MEKNHKYSLQLSCCFIYSLQLSRCVGIFQRRFSKYEWFVVLTSMHSDELPDCFYVGCYIVDKWSRDHDVVFAGRPIEVLPAPV